MDLDVVVVFALPVNRRARGRKYRYYKCNTRLAQHFRACATPAIPMERLDSLVLSALADKVLTPDRLKAMLREMKRRLKQARSREDESLRALQKEVGELEQAANRPYAAVEKDLLPMDEMLRDRAQKLKARREAVLLEIAGA